MRWRPCMIGRLGEAALPLLLLAAAPAAAQQASPRQASHLLVIVGLAGDLENADRFHQWAVTLTDAARERYGLPPDSVIYLGEDPSRDPAHINGRSTRERITAAVETISALARPGELVLIVLIGHGASATGAARFNLPGPDLTASDFAKLLQRLSAQAVVFANTASASGGFVQALSGKGRTIVAATKNDGEKNQTRFGEYFAAAFAEAGADADTDKDGRVSMLEAFQWARARTADSYSREGQLLTEHAVLDDNGDGQGADAPGQPGSDGAVARTLFLSGAASPGAVDERDPQVRALLEQRQALEAKVAALKAAKDETDPAAYASSLEQLLVELARVNRAVREKRK